MNVFNNEKIIYLHIIKQREEFSIMEKQIEIYQGVDGRTQIEVTFEQDTVWLNRMQLATLFDRDVKTIGKHINNVFLEEELNKESVVANFATTATDGKTYQVEHYNLDLIISVGYRVKSRQGTKFRQWATQCLKEYLVQGYAINEARLAQKQQEIQTLKDGIRILSRAIENTNNDIGSIAKLVES
ncbi:virulence RhuM family protein [Leadbetterella sp. DM7]|uniref:virulence RhuM family protein n=1 Tax=Leadbetterella sp. DM7 TaxID=3235085 RepID=UPI00349E6231